MDISASCAPPDEVETQGRITRVQARMAEQGLDYYLCHDPANIFYLTNFANYVHERPFILLVSSTGKLTFLMPKLEEEHVRVRSVGDMQFLHYFEFPAPAGEMWSDRLLDVLSADQCVGVESLCPLAVADAIPGTTVATDIVEDVRQIKSAYEVGRIAYTCGLLNKVPKELAEPMDALAAEIESGE